jgi:hypothetical protein
MHRNHYAAGLLRWLYSAANRQTWVGHSDGSMSQEMNKEWRAENDVL